MDFNGYEDFENFKKAVLFERRYIHTPKVHNFLEALGSTLANRTRILRDGYILWRAQIGYDEIETDEGVEERPYHKTRMKPRRDLCGDGRANPRGIPYLYLADDTETCIAEMRPQNGECLSVAQFQVLRSLRLIDCFSVKREIGNLELLVAPPTTQDDIANAIWNLINQAFSRPVRRTDISSEYVPTQVLTEYFHQQGFDGICFKSGVGPGFNVVLFDLTAAEVVYCGIYTVKAVKYDYTETGNPYFVKEPKI